ncbi:hypothetical protein [Streptomyces sp. NPDC004533]
MTVICRGLALLFAVLVLQPVPGPARFDLTTASTVDAPRGTG